MLIPQYESRAMGIPLCLDRELMNNFQGGKDRFQRNRSIRPAAQMTMPEPVRKVKASR